MTALEFSLLVGGVAFVLTAALLLSRRGDAIAGRLMCLVGWHDMKHPWFEINAPTPTERRWCDREHCYYCEERPLCH